MRWTPGKRSTNLEDRRGSGSGGLPIGRLGIGGTVVLLILSFVFKTDLSGMLGGGEAPSATQEPNGPAGAVATTPEEEKMVQFVSFVLDDAQATWAKIFREQGRTWEDAKLVLFRDATETGCGFGQAASGPFYCPADHKVYIDLGFYQELSQRFGAPGDFAQAYVLAHEIGHHVQYLLGTDSEVRQLQQRDPSRQNALSVRMELQADCYAGVWGGSTAQRNLLDPGDVDEGLAAAAAVGDDRLQRMSSGRVNPDGFTHGSSADRKAWFQRGYTSGRPDACDTFGSAR
jgi:predicted metalloprotease